MKTKTYITNPRRILKIENRMADISIKRDPGDKSTKSFSFNGLDISSVYGSGQIKKDAKIILEISSDIDTQSFELGSYGSPAIIFVSSLLFTNFFASIILFSYIFNHTFDKTSSLT